MHGKLGHNIASQVGVEGRQRNPRSDVPENWPDVIQCPQCKAWQPKTAYQLLARRDDASETLHPVLVCRRSGCKQIFAPSNEYFAATGLPQR